MAKIDLKECLVKIKDGTPSTPNSLTIKVGDGTLTYSEKRNMEYSLDRGTLDLVREGDEVPMDVAFDLVWEFLKSSTSATPTPEEALKKTGAASDWESSSDDDCEPYAVDIVVEHDPLCSNEDLEIVTLPDFRWESLDHDLKAGTISCKGKCNAKVASIARSPQTT